MNQPPPHGQDPYQGGPPYGTPSGGQPAMGPPSGGQPAMGPPPPGGMPPGGMPPGGMPPGGMPPGGGPPPMGPPPPGGFPPGGPGGPGGPYGGDPYGAPGGPGYGGDPYGGQYAGGQYGPPTPPPSKGGGPWLWISLGCGGLFVIGVALVVLLVFFLSDDGGDDPYGGGSSGGTSESEESEGTGEASGNTSTGLGNEERSNPEMPGVGEEVSHNGMAFTITEIEVDADVPGHTPYGQYVVVYVNVTPDGNEDIEFWRDEQHLYTYDDEAIQEDYVATESFDSNLKMDVDLAPGESEVAPIVFDVDDPADISYMGLSAEFLGGDEIEVDVTG